MKEQSVSVAGQSPTYILLTTLMDWLEMKKSLLAWWNAITNIRSFWFWDQRSKDKNDNQQQEY